MRKFKSVSNELKKNESPTMLPLRGTKTSAGYDFYTPINLCIRPQEKVFFWTDVCIEMEEDEVLILDVRSSVGTKKDLMLANTIPVIDSDYVNAENGGNIGIMLRNLKPSIKLAGYVYANIPLCLLDTEDGDSFFLTDSQDKKMTQVEIVPIPQIEDLTSMNTVFIPKGERVAQGIILKYREATNCNTEEQRLGGFGSTND